VTRVEVDATDPVMRAGVPRLHFFRSAGRTVREAVVRLAATMEAAR